MRQVSACFDRLSMTVSERVGLRLGFDDLGTAASDLQRFGWWYAPDRLGMAVSERAGLRLGFDDLCTAASSLQRFGW
ncbi:MAG: hypothetical protein AMXMBFR61_00680 [Fimbriimonadales bacterium]